MIYLLDESHVCIFSLFLKCHAQFSSLNASLCLGTKISEVCPKHTYSSLCVKILLVFVSVNPYLEFIIFVKVSLRLARVTISKVDSG